MSGPYRGAAPGDNAPEPTLADRMQETGRLLRRVRTPNGDDPFGSVDFAARHELRAILDDLPTVPVESCADALALAVLMRDTLGVMVQHSAAEPLAIEAMATTATALDRLRGFLEARSDRTAAEVDLIGTVRPALH